MPKCLFLVCAAATLPFASAASGQAAPSKPIPRADFLKKIDAGFATVDANHDGALTKPELEAAERRALQQRLQAQFKQMDTNHDNQLSFAEFAAAARSNVSVDQITQKLDSNHDGKISIDEFRAPQLATFAKLDANNDGMVSPAEIQAYAKAHGAR
ncbi:MAG: EF-hand domain-containing protein [Sphingomicrobium sp.]